MTNDNRNNFSKELAPCFILEDKYYDQLTTPNQIALYSFLARNAYRGISMADSNIKEFCEPMGITASEFKYIFDLLYEIGFLVKGN